MKIHRFICVAAIMGMVSERGNRAHLKPSFRDGEFGIKCFSAIPYPHLRGIICSKYLSAPETTQFYREQKI